jgi:alpha-beta hydrolase superfamily lysophospholipase
MATISTTMTQERISGTGGVQLFIRSWRPASAARGVVAIVPGFNSHGGYYLWVAEQLTSRNLTVFAVDLRGRGLSEGERFYVDSFADYASDVHAMVTLARARAPGVPVFLFGHSAGGVVSTAYALDHQAELAGLICESVAFQVPAPEFALAVIKGLSHVAPHTHVLKLRNEDFSRDRDVVKFMNQDPLIAHEVQPTKTVAEMVRADERLKRGFPRLTIPVLILHGTKDKATKPSGSRYFFDNAGSSDKTLKLYDGHVHDLLNDLGREIVMRDVARWIEARIR